MKCIEEHPNSSPNPARAGIEHLAEELEAYRIREGQGPKITAEMRSRHML